VDDWTLNLDSDGQIDCIYTVIHIKRHLIFDYNSRISWWIFTIYVPLETGINIVQKRYKINNTNLHVSPELSWMATMYLQFVMTVADAFDQTGCVQLSQIVVQCLSFQLFLREFPVKSLAEKFFRFPQVLIKFCFQSSTHFMSLYLFITH